jgi:hypothetical protein
MNTSVRKLLNDSRKLDRIEDLRSKIKVGKSVCEEIVSSKLSSESKVFITESIIMIENLYLSEISNLSGTMSLTQLKTK